MAYDEKLTLAGEAKADAYYEHGHNSTQYKEAWSKYLDEFKRVARNDSCYSTLDYENPTDFIMEGLMDGDDRGVIEHVLEEFKQMVELLEEAFGCTKWREDYEMCSNAFHGR